MPKTKTSSAVLTGVFLFLCPVAAASVLAAAQKASELWRVIFYGASSGLLAWFWVAVLIAYTKRVKTEGRLQGMNRAMAVLGIHPEGSHGATRP